MPDNYVSTRLTERHDALLFIDRTTALTSLTVQPKACKEHSDAPVGPYAFINDCRGSGSGKKVFFALPGWKVVA
ncbi:hypothetical protein GCM10028818_10890 [Spirosoma horti]